MKDYKATLDLEYAITNPDHAVHADVIFKHYWPDTSRADWKDMPLKANSATELVSQLQAKFLAELKTKSPQPNKADWNISAPFSGNRWRVGAGGLHEGSVVVQYKDDGGPLEDWDFGYGPGTGWVYVTAKWQEV